MSDNYGMSGGGQGDPNQQWGGPPPGQYPQGQYGQPGYGAQPPKKDKTWVYILVGCGVIALIVVIGLGATCAYMASRSGDMMSGIFKMGKPEVMTQLSAEHTEEERQRFGAAYDALFNEMDEIGFIEWAQRYEVQMNEMQAIMADNTVTVEESQDWADSVESAVGSLDYGDYGGGEEY